MEGRRRYGPESIFPIFKIGIPYLTECIDLSDSHFRSLQSRSPSLLQSRWRVGEVDGATEVRVGPRKECSSETVGVRVQEGRVVGTGPLEGAEVLRSFPY